MSSSRNIDYEQVHSAKWHAWTDAKGMPKIPMYWQSPRISSQIGPIYSCLDLPELISTVATKELFLLCSDILDERDFSFANELLGAKGATPYLSRQGMIAALRLSEKRHTGYLVPAQTWKWHKEPTKELLDYLTFVFAKTNYQATTPSALSEKVLRDTLPTPHGIYRPSVMLRRDILENFPGGRIDRAFSAWYEFVYRYDKRKAYLAKCELVPTPFHAPFIRNYPSLKDVCGYAAGFWKCEMVARDRPISPIQIESRYPVEGECFTKWLWTGELMDCLEAGYQLLSISCGYGWVAMSDFMARWADRLWGIYQEVEGDAYLRAVLKAMMVGLPGRMLRQPETYKLVPLAERQEGDLPLLMHWHKATDKKFSDYMIRAEYDKESTALSYIGSYIVAEMRREMYHLMLAEHQNGRKVIQSYIDCYTLNGPTTLRRVGTDVGQYKEERFMDVWAVENRLIGKDDRGVIVVKAPGYGAKENGKNGERRAKLEEEYVKMSRKQ
jgi:hypothetical protein